MPYHASAISYIHTDHPDKILARAPKVRDHREPPQRLPPAPNTNKIKIFIYSYKILLELLKYFYRAGNQQIIWV